MDSHPSGWRILRLFPGAIANDVLAYVRRRLHQQKGRRVREAIDDVLEESAEEYVKSYVHIPQEGTRSHPPLQGGTMEPAEVVKRGWEIYERRWKEPLELTARRRHLHDGDGWG